MSSAQEIADAGQRAAHHRDASVASFTRPADATWRRLVPGESLTLDMGGHSRRWRVVGVRPGYLGGEETYDLEPAEDITGEP